MSDDLRRVVVIGSSCAGKSTFAVDLARALGHPSFDLDPLYYGPNWTVKPTGQFRELTAQAAASERWVASGNYAGVRDILWPRATSVVWLDYRFATVLWRALGRTIRRSLTGEELWHGNRETFRLSFFSRESVLMEVATTFHRRQRLYRELQASGDFPHLTWLVFSRPSKAARFLTSLERSISFRDDRPGGRI